LSGNSKRKGKKSADSPKGKTARDRVLEAAYDVFVENGFSGATTDMIQSASATSKATMYAHFESKEVLFHEMMEHRLSNTMLGYKEVSQNNDRIEDFLEEIGFKLLHDILGEEGINITRLVIAECIRFPHLGTMFYIVGPKTISSIIEMRLSEAHRRKELCVPDPEIAAEQFVGIIKGDLHLRALLGYQVPDEEGLRQFTDQAVAAFLAAYAPRNAPGGQPAGTGSI
jgi:TetR/AcrR family transcriptional repressor of mexJK operon